MLAYIYIYTIHGSYGLGHHEIIKTAAHRVCRVPGSCSVLGPCAACAGAPARGFKRSRLWMLGMFVEGLGRGGVETGTATFAWSTGCWLREGDGLWYFGLQLNSKVLVSRLWLASPMQFVSKSCFGVSIRSMLLVTKILQDLFLCCCARHDRLWTRHCQEETQTLSRFVWPSAKERAGSRSARYGGKLQKRGVLFSVFPKTNPWNHWQRRVSLGVGQPWIDVYKKFMILFSGMQCMIHIYIYIIIYIPITYIWDVYSPASRMNHI